MAKAFILSTAMKNSHACSKAPLSMSGKHNASFYPHFRKDTPKMTAGMPRFLDQRNHFNLIWRGVAWITQHRLEAGTSSLLI